MDEADLVVDVDRPETWPEATRRWTADRADRLDAGHTCDLPGWLDEKEDDLRATFGGRKLLAYHCTRLLPHELDSIRVQGLRLLDKALVQDRIAAAIEHGLSATARAHAETGNIYAIKNLDHREHQVCFVIGRSTLDEHHSGCAPLLDHWGGEAIRGGPADSPALAGVGTATIVVARLNLTSSWRRSVTFPSLAKIFVGTLLGTEDRGADVFYRDPVPPQDVVDIWQPGHPEYDRHAQLPR